MVDERKTKIRILQAQAIVHRHAYWTMGAGVIPLPLFDLLAVVGVQLKMLAQLSAHYDKPFREEVARKVLVSLVSGSGGVFLGLGLGPSLAKFIPVLGQTLAAVSVSTLTAVLTHAVGSVFILHFESGGALLDFEPEDMRAHFKREFVRAKKSYIK